MSILKNIEGLPVGEMEALSTTEALEAVAVHCTNYISAARTAGKLLYRGLQNCSHDYFLARPRTDRLPATTPKQVHDGFVRWMRAKGFTANRDNSVFATSDKRSAELYGALYAIFPVNGFSFTWSPECRDLFHDWAAEGMPNASDEIDALLQGMRYTDRDLPAAISSGNEVMLADSPYLGVRLELVDKLAFSLGLSLR